MKQTLSHAVVIAVLTIVGLTGCAALEEHESSAKLATMYATIKVIDEDAGKAARVVDIATQVREYASGEKLLTVDLLVDQIRSKVRWDRLDAADELLVQALLDELAIQLKERLGENVLPEDLRLAVDKVAEWVIQAARMT